MTSVGARAQNRGQTSPQHREARFWKDGRLPFGSHGRQFRNSPLNDSCPSFDGRRTLLPVASFTNASFLLVRVVAKNPTNKRNDYFARCFIEPVDRFSPFSGRPKTTLLFALFQLENAESTTTARLLSNHCRNLRCVKEGFQAAARSSKCLWSHQPNTPKFFLLYFFTSSASTMYIRTMQLVTANNPCFINYFLTEIFRNNIDVVIHAFIILKISLVFL